MVRINAVALVLFLVVVAGHGQYTDYIGAGQTDGVIVTTSSDYQPINRMNIASGEKTIMGDGLDGKRIEASRFLSQATMGVDPEVINYVAEIGIEAWIDEQIELPTSNYLEETQFVYNYLREFHINTEGSASGFQHRPNSLMFNYAWFDINMSNQDYLRQRVALALSEIFVVSANSGLNAMGDGIATYYDILSDNAFGNFEDLLREITYNTSMGFYLSHLNNPKSDPANNTHPDENYAREVMQLFSIGLYELNNDGSRKLDADGELIPTYDNADIREFAKVFTGLGVGGVLPDEFTDTPFFGMGLWVADMSVPMIMHENHHEQGEKTLLNGFVIPAGQSGIEDIDQAVNHLFNHPNVGPFIVPQLIQRLVKSNPSPEYIERVTTIFNDNGEGVRGDLGAVIKAILLDEEARSCEKMLEPTNGKMREQLLKYTDFARKIDKLSPSGMYWDVGIPYLENAGQIAVHSPSVFNFFAPDFQPVGAIASMGLVAPEFQLHNSRTSIGYANRVHRWLIWENLFSIWVDGDHGIYSHTDLSAWVEAAKDDEVLINKLDVEFTNGQMSTSTRNIIKEAIEVIPATLNGINDRITLAMYLVLVSPDYVVLK